MTNNDSPTRAEYEHGFDLYVLRVQGAGGSIGKVKQDAVTGLYTWAVSIPGHDKEDRDRRLEECYRAFRVVEVNYARRILGEGLDRTRLNGSQRTV